MTSSLKRRMVLLEADSIDGDYLPLVTIDDICVSDRRTPAAWSDDVAGVCFTDGREWTRHEGEALADFRHRVSREIGVKGPAGALPHIVDLIMLSGLP